MNENDLLLNDIIYIMDNNIEENTFSNLIRQWGFNEEFLQNLTDKQIDLEALKCLTLDDIEKLIPVDQLGLRSKFRQKLFEWRYAQGFSTPLADTISVNSGKDTVSWLTNSSFCSNNNNKTETSNSTEIDNELNLKSILLQSLFGKEILRKQNLSGDDRKQLVQIVCEQWLNKNYFPTKSDYENIVVQITNLFKSENQDLYIGNSKNKGILIQKFYNLTKKYQSNGLVKSRYNLKRKISTETSSEATLKNQDLSWEGNEDILWLKRNKSPEETIIEKWKKTFKIREQQSEKNIDLFLEWPILRQSIGSQLIKLDFDQKYPNNTLLLPNFQKFKEKIISIYNKSIKDKKSKELLKNLDKSSEDSYNFIIINLLNSVLLPNIIKDKRTVWKPTIIDAQDSLAIFVNNIKEIPLKIKRRKDIYTEKGWTVQPLVVVVGECIENLEMFFVFYNDIFYEYKNFLEALSGCFELHQILNIEYAKECLQVWHFIEDYFYNFPISGKTSNALISLVSDLNNN